MAIIEFSGDSVTYNTHYMQQKATAHDNRPYIRDYSVILCICCWHGIKINHLSTSCDMRRKINVLTRQYIHRKVAHTVIRYMCSDV